MPKFRLSQADQPENDSWNLGRPETGKTDGNPPREQKTLVEWLNVKNPLACKGCPLIEHMEHRPERKHQSDSNSSNKQPSGSVPEQDEQRKQRVKKEFIPDRPGSSGNVGFGFEPLNKRLKFQKSLDAAGKPEASPLASHLTIGIISDAPLASQNNGVIRSRRLMVNSLKKAPSTTCLPYTMARLVPLRM